MVITTGMIVTMALQVGASFLTQKLNAKKVKELKKFQQESKAAATARGIMYDYEKFKQSCEFQIQAEEESHKYKLEIAGNNFIDKLSQMAHNDNVRLHYPLKISPYIVQKAVIPICGTQLEHSRQEILCVLTYSNDDDFNTKVIPYLDDLLCETIASLWNQSSLHTMCYYRNVWKEDFKFCEENIENLKAVISTPTITITPLFVNDNNEQTLEVEINIWDSNNDFSCHIPTGLKSSQVYNLSKGQIKAFAQTIFPLFLCPMAQLVDIYYWTTYYYAPLLPQLISDGLIEMEEEIKIQYAKAYSELYNSLALGNELPTNLVCNEDCKLIKSISDINQFNFPKRNMNFLEVVLKMSLDKSDVDKIIINTIASLYECRTADQFKSAQLINVKLLTKEDMCLLSSLNKMAKKCGRRDVSKKITDIISRKIVEWD